MTNSPENILIDVRSPSEFEVGHIPGARNIPLFSDEERHLVGLTYKQNGKEKAIAYGLELSSPKFESKVQALKRIAITSNQVTLYCWRGGMRSASMSWLFNQNGFDTKTINGGYKAWRKHIRAELNANRKLIVLSGYTGCAKTEILEELKERGEQVIDLEGLANHRGSAFGQMGDQPTTEHFHNLLGQQLLRLDPNIPTWVEDESKSIGTVHLADEFKSLMNQSIMVDVHREFEERVDFLCNMYGEDTIEELIAGFQRISKKMGGQHAKSAIVALENKDLKTACRHALAYYDRTYQYARDRSNRKPIYTYDSSKQTIQETAANLISWKNQNLPN